MNLYHWVSQKGVKNLGDEISAKILEKIFNVTPVDTGLIAADVLSTGSTLGWVYENKGMLNRTKILYILGSGFMHPWPPLSSRNYLNFKLVRGYLTDSILSDVTGCRLPVGDPGVLFADLVGDIRVEKKYKYGIIPHMGSFGKKDYFNRFDSIEETRVIDFRTDDYLKVAKEMLECDIILSQSLHGLVFSDSLLIPNVWLDFGKMHPGGAFKFYDYFSSIGRPFYKKCDEKLISDDEIEKNLFCADSKIVSEIRSLVRLKFSEVVSDFI